MLDIPSDPNPLAARIGVEDYIELGRLVAEWATDAGTRPAGVQELKDQLAGIATVPDRVRTVRFVQGTPEHLIIHLPAKAIVEENLERMSDPLGNPNYPLPQFYADHCRPGFGPVMTPLDTLLARIGDQTIAQCR